MHIKVLLMGNNIMFKGELIKGIIQLSLNIPLYFIKLLCYSLFLKSSNISYFLTISGVCDTGMEVCAGNLWLESDTVRLYGCELPGFLFSSLKLLELCTGFLQGEMISMYITFS